MRAKIDTPKNGLISLAEKISNTKIFFNILFRKFVFMLLSLSYLILNIFKKNLIIIIGKNNK